MFEGAVPYLAAYLAGAYCNFRLGIPALWTLTAAGLFFLGACLDRKKSLPFICCAHLALFSLGAGAVHCGYREADPPPGIGYLQERFSISREHISSRLRAIVPDKECHATLCAISIGEKEEMGRPLTDAYKGAGAMHILALSGLHVGIIFGILSSLLSVSGIFQGGKKFKAACGVAAILYFAAVTGCSPSVMRASLMIALYQLASATHRKAPKWNIILLAGTLIATAAPFSITTLSFKLSFAAIAGIAAFYPVCDAAIDRFFFRPSNNLLTKVTLTIWKNIFRTLAISICCQAATLPFVLYHFGYAAPYYLITNIVAIPLATIALKAVFPALLLQRIPLLGPALGDFAGAVIQIMNDFIRFIN